MGSKTSKAEQTKLRCLYTNADTLANKLTELKTVIDMEKPHLVAVTEVVPKHSKLSTNGSELQIEGYTAWHNLDEIKGTESPKARGIVIYTQHGLDVHVEKVGTETMQEALFISIKLHKSKDSFLVGTMYRSPNSTSDNNDNLLKIIKSLGPVSKYSHILLLGDYNFKNIDWESGLVSGNCDDEEKFLEATQDAYLYQHVRQPTRARGRDVPSLIDLIFTNEENMISNVEHLSPLGSSDHCVIKFTYNCYIDGNPGQRRLKYCYDKGDFDEIRKELKNDWNKMITTGDIDKDYDSFLQRYKDSVSRHIPTKRSCSTNSDENKKRKLSLDMNVMSQIKIKQRRWRRYMETKDPEKYKLYRVQRNYVKKLVKQAMKKIEKEVASKIKSNPKHFWAYVNSKSKARQNIPKLRCPITGITCTSDYENATALSEQFKSVFTKEPDGPLPHLTDKKTENVLQDLYITENMVFEKLTKLNKAKSPGPDGVHPHVLREIAAEISKPLAIIFNNSIKSQKAAQFWKIANIAAVFKKGAKDDPQNYRPISLTSVVCKVFESIIRDHIMKYLIDNQLLSLKQYGFMMGRSTTLQLLKVLDFWTQAFDDGDQIDCIYLDFKKAFDTVPHKRLIAKLEHKGIQGNILGWIKNYLQNRTQQVVINGVCSDEVNVLSGVPQGSVLGPLLFLVYIDDLPLRVLSEVFLFADDTKLFRIILNKRDQAILQKDLNCLNDWSNKWLLEFNPSKCKFVHFGKQKYINNAYYLVDKDGFRNEIQNKEFEKDIGIFVDKKLDFGLHIAQKTKQANQIMGIIRRTFRYMSEDMFVMLYTTLVRPHLEYGVSVWNPYKKKYIDQIEKVQRRATKQVSSLCHLSYELRLKKLNLYTLSFRRLRGDMIETFKIMTNLYDCEVSPNLILSTNTRTRGNDKKLSTRRARHDFRKHFFTLRITKQWNSLPNEVINCSKVPEFKLKLDKFWNNNPMKYKYRE